MHVPRAPSLQGLPPGPSSPKVRPCLCREPGISQQWWSLWCHGAAGCPRRDAHNLWVRKPPVHTAPWHERWAAREALLDSFLKISFSRPVIAWNLSGLDFFFPPSSQLFSVQETRKTAIKITDPDHFPLSKSQELQIWTSFNANMYLSRKITTFINVLCNYGR